MTNISFRSVLAAALAAVVVAAPAAAANKEHQQLMADIRMMQEQAQQLQNLIGTLNEALKAVNARLDEQTNGTRKALADQKLGIDNLTNDLRVVREKVDDNNVRVSSLTQELDALRQAIQQSAPRATATEPDPGSGATASTAPPATAGSPPVVAVGTSPQRLWDTAYADYTSGQWDLAVLGFESYIRNFPKSDMADDAEVLIGNSYLNDAKYEKAIEAYDTTIRNYPNGNAVPEAYFKKGLALKNLKQLDRAREAFEFAAKNYPDSDAGRLAKQQVGR